MNFYTSPMTSYGLAFAAALAVSSMALTVQAHGTGGHNPQVAQTEKKEPTIGATKLNDTLTMLSGVGGFTGGNVVVSNGPDGMLIIDDKLSTMTDKLTAALKDIDASNDLKFVLNTHWHFDHVGGNEEFGKTATIIAHTNVRKRMSTPQKIDLFKRDLPASPASALPVVTFDDSLSIHFNGEEIKVMHMPSSHTDTDSIMYFTKSNVLHMGDLFFNGIFPFVDIQNGGDIVNLTKNIEKVMAMFPADTTVVPGHGGLAKMEDLKTYHKMLTETTSNVSRMIKDGKTLDEIKAAGVPEAWAGYGWLIDVPTWNGIIHSSLTK